VAKDKRVKTVGIFNSGAFDLANPPKLPGGVSLPAGKGLPNLNPKDMLSGDTFNVPAFYSIGGPTDFAYENANHAGNNTIIRV
jgi:hypothetical protein